MNVWRSQSLVKTKDVPVLKYTFKFLCDRVYLFMVVLNKQQIQQERRQKSTEKLRTWSTPRRIGICPKNSSTVAPS